MSCRRSAVILLLAVVLVCAALLRYIYIASPRDAVRQCNNDNRFDFENLAEFTSENLGRLQRLTNISHTTSYTDSWSVYLNFSPNSRLLAISGWRTTGISGLNDGIIDLGTLLLWELPTSCFTEFGQFGNHQGPWFAGFSSSSDYLLVSYSSCICHVLYTLPEGREITTFDNLPDRQIVFRNSDDDNWGTVGGMSVISQENRLQIYELGTHKLLHEFPFEKKIDAVSFSPDGKLMAVSLEGLRSIFVEIWAVPISES